ncbi:MAG: ATP-dependent RNA helicase DbpA [Candidatus Cloacimonetes bacterium ADurb.Bin211]|nr:MAG: ATP-dependent RNA helicase DbpA [Candidatus Cloacimonetes bacterium ADurb.Bin211]
MLNRSPLSQLEEDVNAADEIALRTILDTMDFDATEATDILPGSDISENTDDSSHRKLLQMAKEAESLFGDRDYKLLRILDPIKKLLKEGYSPIIFCRFIETANYLTEQLKERLDIPDLDIVSVTGLLPPKEREMRINELSQCEKRILVCTDCLSEGINLQDHFNAVIHYDLSWNPTRHEQREGRVDRFGQPSKVVKLITYFGIDNQIDGIVLDVLLRKHRQIKASLGVSVPIPTDVDKVIEAIFEGLLLKEKAGSPEQLLIEGFNDIISDDIQNLHKDWEKASEREKESRSLFAQSTIKIEEITKELNSIRESIGTSQNIKEFLKFSLILYDAIIKEEKENYLRFDLSSVNQIVKENCNIRENDLKIAFQLPIQQNEIYVTRTHPIVEGLSNLLITAAIDDNNRFAVAKRCGVFRTSAIQTKTVLLLLRYRFHLIQYYENQIHRSLVEDSQILAFTGPPEEPHWLNEQEFSILLDSRPTANVLGELSYDQINKILEKYPIIQPRLEEFAENRAKELLESHLRVRNAALFKAKENPQIEPIQPPDLLGIYVYLPQIGVII